MLADSLLEATVADFLLAGAAVRGGELGDRPGRSGWSARPSAPRHCCFAVGSRPVH
ncbi:hypothetical protein QRX50_13730 [Amycolatopsis carbonis]|uniref:Uncharacterized protein n=1 Tax=Amycolatopsis carbonis TaxID=715471 RepID=A0A9Y2IL03_9PSEU|nr:hypothetical protein [Amycolatopsis sp. 2-15]WIX81737.1 hypothetical protein QRX50_13730 [Amycolatopsis sp. 2-15]